MSLRHVIFDFDNLQQMQIHNCRIVQKIHVGYICKAVQAARASVSSGGYKMFQPNKPKPMLCSSFYHGITYMSGF